MPIKKVKPRKCKNPDCKKTFTPQYSTVQPVCSPKCAIEYNKHMEKVKADKEWRKEKKVLKKELETKPELEKKLQKDINAIIRHLDKGHDCMSSLRPLGLDVRIYHAGHLYSVGSHPELRFHLFNIFGQSIEQNKNKGGNPLGYLEGLEKTFGLELKETCLNLKGTSFLKLSKEEIREKISIAKGIIKWIKLQDRTFSNEERITLREQFQAELGIYPPIEIKY